MAPHFFCQHDSPSNLAHSPSDLTFFYRCSDSGRNESTPQTQSNVSWILSKAELEISFMKTHFEKWPPPHSQIYSCFWYAFSLFLRKFHFVNPFNGNFCSPGRAQFAEEKMEFPSQVAAKRILFYFQPKSDRFRTLSGAVHDERAEYTCSCHGLCSKMWNPPRTEVETLCVSTKKKHIRFGNEFVEGVRPFLTEHYRNRFSKAGTLRQKVTFCGYGVRSK